jgi:hypothetical protein
MQWYRSSGGKFYLIVAPLHGIGNKNGEGIGVNILAFEYPKDVNTEWYVHKIASNMHLTHNFEIRESGIKVKSGFYLAGKEGVKFIREDSFTGPDPAIDQVPGMDSAAGEIRIGKGSSRKNFMATIEPMHGQNVAIYPAGWRIKKNNN